MTIHTRDIDDGRLVKLDALHPASALVASAAVEDLVLLTLDARIRASAAGLGLRVAPA